MRCAPTSDIRSQPGAAAGHEGIRQSGVSDPRVPTCSAASLRRRRNPDRHPARCHLLLGQSVARDQRSRRRPPATRHGAAVTQHPVKNSVQSRAGVGLRAPKAQRRAVATAAQETGACSARRLGRRQALASATGTSPGSVSPTSSGPGAGTSLQAPSFLGLGGAASCGHAEALTSARRQLAPARDSPEEWLPAAVSPSHQHSDHTAILQRCCSQLIRQRRRTEIIRRRRQVTASR